ncbi:hypothetical protein OGAPHI_003098 [Ogataea philodendri]|uniref:EVE domain-containing protein n=1 Tax=Ogataea philodendri TaxID=1378263 RepID=A0A9P8P9L9_9ASCO|nr:uncharacterized protein OGAPHI_003098 [Ogataea philodendri]KAH3667449.1 hypothetical protein OGAPHI_003098 [Ogataea philodendri]
MTRVAKRAPKKPAGDGPPVPGKPPVYDKDKRNRRFWLVKSEPMPRVDAKTGKTVKFSIYDLAQVPAEPWDGVRNYEARNYLIQMAKDDVCLFYHSNCKNPGIVGLCTVASTAKPDRSQFDPQSPNYDPKAGPDQPRWWCPEMAFLCLLNRKLSLAELRESKGVEDLYLLKRGRLSVTPVSEKQFWRLMQLQEGPQGTDAEMDCPTQGLPRYSKNLLA